MLIPKFLFLAKICWAVFQTHTPTVTGLLLYVPWTPKTQHNHNVIHYLLCLNLCPLFCLLGHDITIRARDLSFQSPHTHPSQAWRLLASKYLLNTIISPQPNVDQPHWYTVIVTRSTIFSLLTHCNRLLTGSPTTSFFLQCKYKLDHVTSLIFLLIIRLSKLVYGNKRVDPRVFNWLSVIPKSFTRRTWS